MNSRKSYLELSAEDINQHATLTKKEKAAIDAFIRAARALPRTICAEIIDDEGQTTLTVCKRITARAAKRVAGLRKKSLCF
jgi:hypothetical protein